MFEITSNQSIKINRGDSASFVVFMDMGTIMQPIAKTFVGCNVKVVNKSSNIIVDSIDKNNWFNSQRATGTYTFTYVSNNWYLNGASVNLLTYGITINSSVTLSDNNFISIEYTRGDSSVTLPHGSSVEFYFININHNPKDYPLMKKTFYTDGTIITRYGSNTPTTSYNYGNINDDGNFIVTLTSDDTSVVDGGNYMYLLKVSYQTNGVALYATISNKKMFYLVDDDFSGRMWNVNPEQYLHCYLL